MNLRRILVISISMLFIGCDTRVAPPPAASWREEEEVHTQFALLTVASWREEEVWWTGRSKADIPGLDNSSAWMLAREGRVSLVVWTRGFGGPGSTGGGGSGGTSSYARLQQQRTSKDGHTVEWETEVSEDGPVSFKLNDKPYDLNKGAVFLVFLKGTTVDITQVNPDLNDIKIKHSSSNAGTTNVQPIMDANCKELETLIDNDSKLKDAFATAAQDT